jgi:hypothetical protein
MHTCAACKESRKTQYYKWYNMVTKELNGFLCEKCAIRHNFGSNFKQNKRYLRWIRENENG